MKQNKNGLTVRQMAATGLLAAVMCVLGPMSVPIGPVPLSLTNLAVSLAAVLLGAKLGAASVMVYLLIGAVGLPVFSGYAGGLAKLAGPTGGYLIGFVPMALVAGLVWEKCHGKPLPALAGLALGCALDYAFGTVWFVAMMGCDVGYALAVCVLPFLPGDAVKLALGYALGMVLRRRLGQAGLLPGE